MRNQNAMHGLKFTANERIYQKLNNFFTNHNLRDLYDRWLMDMMHSSMVMDGHRRIPEGKYNFWEPKTKEEGYHPYNQNLKRYPGLWSVCYKCRRARFLGQTQES